MIFETMLIRNRWKATGGKYHILDEQDNQRNILKEKKCLGNHGELKPRPRPLTLAVDALTTELRLLCRYSALSLGIRA